MSASLRVESGGSSLLALTRNNVILKELQCDLYELLNAPAWRIF